MSLGPIKVTRVTRDVYCVQRVKMLSCSYFVIQSDGVVLIDAGMDVCVEYEGGDEFEIQRYLECAGT